jgi:Tfp pilus assembly protein PilE
MNKKGFTVVELMVTFVLIATISTILIQLVLTLKDLYVSGDMRTTLLTKQGTMTKKIYDDLDNKTLTEIKSCEGTCIEFVYEDTSKKLIVDKTNKKITYDNYTIKLGNKTGSSFGTISSSTYKDDTKQIFRVTVPINNKLLKGDYGIDIVYQDSNNINIDTSNFK